ncbi:uncharacterized protein KY384_006385 [Bacidia gigantensis]|uniref:uncharacterized protein n=1 Tax=Bacidia gigantensis TaxID=2732470 RepID=UPI001D058A6E|nr:uncharacterized protein KY384_006385 [Bacidia gigantensis]KAG8528698.1 hypothetical protein KY384_006385 [Bacidia gigantensis]
MASSGYHPSTAAWSSGVVSPMTRDHRGSFDFNQPPQQPAQWHSPFPEAGSMSAGHSSPGDTSHSYWGRHTDSPLTPAYSPHMSVPTTSMPMDSRNSFTSFAPPRNDSTWSAPARSTSLGVVEDYPSGYQRSQYHPQPLSLDLRRRPSDMHPPSLMTSTNSSHTSISESSLTPMSAPVSSPPDHWGVPSNWSALPNSAVTKPTDFGTWYSEPTLEKVQEEDLPPRYGEQPAIVYVDGEHQ